MQLLDTLIFVYLYPLNWSLFSRKGEAVLKPVIVDLACDVAHQVSIDVCSGSVPVIPAVGLMTSYGITGCLCSKVCASWFDDII